MAVAGGGADPRACWPRRCCRCVVSLGAVHRAADLPAGRAGQRPDRWRRAGRAGRGDRRSAGQLLVHPAVRIADHRATRERLRPRGFRGRRSHGGVRGRSQRGPARRQARPVRAEAQLRGRRGRPASSTRRDPVHAVLEQARVGFGMRVGAAAGHAPATVGAVDRCARPGRTLPPPRTARSTRTPPTSPSPAGADWVLALYGRPLTAADRAWCEVFAAQAVLGRRAGRLTAEAEQGERLRQADRVRTAVLAALSHDLRTPLATIKASVSSLRDRLDRLVRGGPDGAAGGHRRGRRPAGRAAGEPAGPVPAADRRAGPAPAGRSRWTRWCTGR